MGPSPQGWGGRVCDGHISVNVLVENATPPTLLRSFRCANCQRDIFRCHLSRALPALGSPLGLWALGQFAWAVLALGWTLAAPLAPVDSPSMVQPNVSSVSPYSSFMLDTSHHGSGLDPARGGHRRRCNSQHSLAREGVCPGLEHIQCTESAALLPSLLNPEM